MRELLGFGLLLSLALPAAADLRQLVPATTLEAIAAETTGAAPKRHLDAISVEHRMRTGSQFDRATDHILEALRGYPLDEVSTIEFPADGKTLIGTQKSRPVWEVDGAELWEVTGDSASPQRVRRLADWESVPLSLAQDSHAAAVLTTLVDVGAGTAEADYAGKDVAGKLVLTASQPGAVAPLAVERYGAAGIVSHAPNQKSAWWLEDDRLVRWGHLDSFTSTRTFGFMISLGEARALRQRLAAGEEIHLQARVDARQRTGRYRFATAALRGASLPEQEIHYSCHLDHPRPGANDNVSGCVAILEVARTLATLVDRGILPRPARTLRFLWPAEIEGTIMYLARHENAQRIKANIHMDMVGGAPVTRSVFRIAGGPLSAASFVADVGHEIGHFVNRETLRYTDGEATDFPLVAPTGGKEPLLAQMQGLDMGSDHDVFFEGSWRIPGLYVHEWPDRYIHTNFDLAANIDPTKLKRAAFIGAVAGWYLANLSADDVPALLALLERNALARGAGLLARQASLDEADAARVAGVHFAVEADKLRSIKRFVALDEAALTPSLQALDKLAALLDVTVPGAGDRVGQGIIYRRNPDLQGPMIGFGYSYLEDRLPADRLAALALRDFRADEGLARQYTYEALNLVDGRRDVAEIRDWLTAELGPVPESHVAGYLAALAEIGVIEPAAQP